MRLICGDEGQRRGKKSDSSFLAFPPLVFEVRFLVPAWRCKPKLARGRKGLSGDLVGPTHTKGELASPRKKKAAFTCV